MMLKMRQPPHSLEAEEAVIGSMCLGGDKVIPDVVALLGDGAAFYAAEFRVIYNQLREMHELDEPLELTALMRRLEATSTHGKPWEEVVMDSYQSVASYITAEHYAKIILDEHARRQMITLAAALTADAYAERGESASDLALARAHQLESIAGHLVRDDRVIGFRDIAVELKARTTKVAPTGIVQLDDRIAGIILGHLTIIAARPTVGKTSLALSMAYLMSRAETHKILFFSLEQDQIDIGYRLLGIHTGSSVDGLIKGHNDELFVNSWIDEMLTCRLVDGLFFCFKSDNAEEICQLAKSAIRRHNISVVFIDYLQLMSVRRDRTENREQEVSRMTKMLKRLATTLGVAVVCLSQLNRSPEGRRDGRPRLSDLRESGSIEQNSDLVLLMTKRDLAPEIRVAKNRNGPQSDWISLAFDPQTMFFRPGVPQACTEPIG